jgi:hypothetical protein
MTETEKPEPEPRCPMAPAGESHRWRIAPQGSATLASGSAGCKWCGAVRTFTPDTETSVWSTRSERGGGGDPEGDLAREHHR